MSATFMQSRRERMRRRNARPRSGLRPAQRACVTLPAANSKTGISHEKPCQEFSQLFCNFFSRNLRRADSRVAARERLHQEHPTIPEEYRP